MRECNVCGAVYDEGKRCKLYCSEECQKKAGRDRFKLYYQQNNEDIKQKAKEKYLKKKQNELQKKIDSNNLVAIAIAADRAGMTYGQYVAKMEHGKIKR